MGLRNGRAPLLVLLADVILSLRLRSASAEKALSCPAGQRLLARATDIRRPSGVGPGLCEAAAAEVLLTWQWQMW